MIDFDNVIFTLNGFHQLNRLYVSINNNKECHWNMTEMPENREFQRMKKEQHAEYFQLLSRNSFGPYMYMHFT